MIRDEVLPRIIFGRTLFYINCFFRPVYSSYPTTTTTTYPQASRNFGGGVGLQLGPLGFGLGAGLGPNGLNGGGGLGFGNYQSYGTPNHYKQYYSRYPSQYQQVYA